MHLFYIQHPPWWWRYPTPSEVWDRGETPRKPNNRDTPQNRNQRSKIEDVVPKMARWRGLVAGQFRRR